jgi:recombination protein RecT
MNEVAKREKTISERFTEAVAREFSSVSGEMVQFSPNQKRLAQHLFVKADAALKDLEKKRISDNKMNLAPYVWKNINMQKMSTDAIHRIEIGLDALIPNHLSMIPYWNKRLEKYDLDLQIGYAGKDYYRRKMAFDEPIDMIYELVFSNDIFEPIKKGSGVQVESYKFEIPKPFDRGPVVGGFGYIVYKDQTKNKLIIVTETDFVKSMGEAKSKTFWNKHPEAMRYKTIVNRTTDKLLIDPEKTSVSFFEVEHAEYENGETAEPDFADQIIDIDPKEVKEVESEKEEVEEIPEEKAEENAEPIDDIQRELEPDF